MSMAIGYKLQKLRLIVNTIKFAKIKRISAFEECGLHQILITIKQNNESVAEIFLKLFMDISVKQIFQFILKELGRSRFTYKWTCYSVVKDCYLQENDSIKISEIKGNQFILNIKMDTQQQKLILKPINHKTQNPGFNPNISYNEKQDGKPSTNVALECPKSQQLLVYLENQLELTKTYFFETSTSNRILDVFQFLKQVQKLEQCYFYFRLPGDCRQWICYSETQGKYLNMNDKLGPLNSQILTIEISGNTRLKNKLFLQFFVQTEGREEVFSYSPKDFITLEELFTHIKNHEKLLDSSDLFICFSLKRNKHIKNSKIKIDESFADDILAFKTFKGLYFQVKCQAQQEIPILNNKLNNPQKTSNQCLNHPGNQIKFICFFKHFCKKILCEQCLSDSLHVDVHKSSILQIEQFTKQVQETTQQLQKQKNQAHNLYEKFLEFQKRVEEKINIYQKSLSNVLLQFMNFEQCFQQIMSRLQQCQILDDNYQEINQIISLFQTEKIKNLKLVNQINLQKITQNIDKFEQSSILYQEQIDGILFKEIFWNDQQFLFQNHQINTEIEKKKQMNERNELRQEELNNEKYIFASGLKLQIFINSMFTRDHIYQCQNNTSIQDVCIFINETFRIHKNPDYQWILYSRALNKFITDMNDRIEEIIKLDVLKINIVVPCGEAEKLKQQIIVGITIINEEVIINMKKSFNPNCMLKNIEEAILNFCKLSKEEASIDLFIGQRPLCFSVMKQKKLYELFFEKQVNITAKIRKIQLNMDEMNMTIQNNNMLQDIDEQYIKLSFAILDGVQTRECILKLNMNQTFNDIKLTIAKLFGIQQEMAYIEVESIEKYKQLFPIYLLSLPEDKQINCKIKWFGE